MCGIAGILGDDQHPVDRPLLEKMCTALAHRGPDDAGYHYDHHMGLGQRRLRIIDLASGHQPMSNEDGSIWVTFNGEIYNFLELRPGLEQQGHRFATASDTEVIVHAYEQYGPECVKQLGGMFAFALWDARQQTLLLARDRAGKKPLFYAWADGQFIFASELQALVKHPGIRRQIDAAAVEDYLTYGYIPAPRTAFVGISKLPPAHYLTLRRPGSDPGTGQLRVERYWDLRYTPKVQLDEEEATEELLQVLTRAVQQRLVADVPLGALLSGGIDSSLVVALMSQLSSQPVKTFSIGFEEQAFNELPYARLVAQRYGTDHHELVVRPQALEVLPTLVRHYGEPYADSSAIPTYYVAKLTREHVKVALNGDGGDESYAGYDRYLGSILADRYRRIPRTLRKVLIEPLAALIPDSLPRRSRLAQGKRFVQGAGMPLAERYLRWMSVFTPKQKRESYTPEFKARLAGHDGAAFLLDRFRALNSDELDAIDTVLAVDVQSYLPYDLLVKMDIASMANSLEARSPFLDYKVMEFSARLPSGYKLHKTSLKYLLKKLGKRLLPPECLKRRKMGFSVPLAQWLRTELRPLLEEQLLDPSARTREFLQPGPLRCLVQAHVSGQEDHSAQLWALLCLELWYREFLPG